MAKSWAGAGLYHREMKKDAVEVAFPCRRVRYIAIMPSKSCGDLRQLLERGLFTKQSFADCYESGKQCTVDEMESAVRKLLGEFGWTRAEVDRSFRFFGSDITTTFIANARNTGRQLDWVFLDYCGIVGFDVWKEIFENWTASAFTADAEISFTANRKGRGESKRYYPVCKQLSAYAHRVRANVVGKLGRTGDVGLGLQVALCYAMPFAARIKHSLAYDKGMLVFRIGRTKGCRGFSGPKGPFDRAIASVNPAARSGTNPQYQKWNQFFPATATAGQKRSWTCSILRGEYPGPKCGITRKQWVEIEKFAAKLQK